MASEATGLRLSSLSPELAVSKIHSRIGSFGTIARVVMVIASLSVPVICHARSGAHTPTTRLTDENYTSQPLRSLLLWHLDGRSLLIGFVVAMAVCGFSYWMVRRSLRNGKPTKVRLPLLRLQPLAHWATQSDETRNELSRELHDSVGPLLTAMGLQLTTLRSSPKISSELNAQLQEVSQLNSEALRQIRDLAMGIRPALLTDVNLVAALDHQARQFSRHTGIASSVRADARLEGLPEEHRACIYRCVSEALTNCAKHSHSKNIHILVGLSEGSVTVQVEDDGVGIEKSRHRMGLGLIGMRERVSRLNGRFSLTSHHRGGTSIKFEIPVPRGVLA